MFDQSIRLLLQLQIQVIVFCFTVKSAFIKWSFSKGLSGPLWTKKHTQVKKCNFSLLSNKLHFTSHFTVDTNISHRNQFDFHEKLIFSKLFVVLNRPNLISDKRKPALMAHHLIFVFSVVLSWVHWQCFYLAHSPRRHVNFFSEVPIWHAREVMRH